MKLRRDQYISYYGVFTYKHAEKPDIVWKGKTDEIRVEISSNEKPNQNWLAVMFLYGRQKIHPSDLTLGEICRASQEEIDQFKCGDVINVKYGTYLIGEFEVLYLDKASPPS